MGVRFYVSTANAPFFVDNVMGYGDSVPVTGDYKVGDFIISSTQADGIFGWVCTKAGTPGTWEIIGSGKSGGGEDTPITLTGFSNVVEFDDARNTIAIGIPEYNVETDFLEVHYNGLLLAEGVHYRVDSSNKSIVKLEGNWNPGNYTDQQMIFKVIRGEQGNGKLVQIRKTIDLNTPTTEVITGIPEYVPGTDIMEVHLNGVLLMESIDYRYASGKIIKLDASSPWNPHSVQGQKMYIRVIKNKGNLVPGGGEILDNSIGIEKLSPDLVAKINNSKDPRVGELNNLQTTIKTDVVAAINEIKGKADEAFQSGNNAKQGLVDALVAKGIEASTSESWKSLNDKVEKLATVKYIEKLPDWYTPKLAVEDTWLVNTDTIPRKRAKLTAVAVGNKIYCFTGKIDRNISSQVDCFDTKNNIWETKTAMPDRHTAIGACAIGDKIYCVGGCDYIDNGSSDVQRLNRCYDTINDTWENKAILPTTAFGVLCIAKGEQMYCINNKNNYLYTPITNTWETKAIIPNGAVFTKGGLINNKIYTVITGSSSRTFTYEYSCDLDTYTEKSKYPDYSLELDSVSCSVLGNFLYMMGGNNSMNIVKKTYCYDPSTNTWTQKSDSQEYGCECGCATVGPNIYLLGGSNTNTDTESNLRSSSQCYIP